MESNYREMLRTARNKKGLNNPLVNTKWFYKSLNSLEKLSQAPAVEIEPKSLSKAEPSSAEENPTKKPEGMVSKENKVTEKIKMLDSLNLFGEKKLEKSDHFKFDGGEIVRTESNVSTGLEFSNLTYNELTQEFQKHLSDENGKIKLHGLEAVKDNQVEVVFISDSYRRVKVEETERKLDLYFEADVSNLFDRMIGAMKLRESNSYVTALDNDFDSKNSLVLSEICLLKPKLIISLGATATNFLIGNTQRLKDIHGEIREIKIKPNNQSAETYKLMPLFSPSLLLTAPNMKKTAWTDMQKAMEFLGL